MEDNNIWGYLWGGIATLVMVIQFISQRVKEAKEATKIDEDQNLAISTLNGRIDTLNTSFDGKIKSMQGEFTNLKDRVNGLDNKTAKEISKLEDKLESKLDKITELIMKLMKT